MSDMSNMKYPNHWASFALLFYAVLLSIALLSTSTSLRAALANQLNNHPSPYLAMHSDDPVAWQVWGEDVLVRARKENKMLFVSVGYFACHWCHVMQKESYSDSGVATKLNKDFIPVKVDRELYPALDAYLIDFVQRTRGHAGWPLNVFLTPDGYPVVGITYLPKREFTDLVVKLRDLWKKDPGYLSNVASQAAAIQSKKSPLEKNTKQALVEIKKESVNKYLASFIQQAIQQSDEMLGGFGDQAKFPSTSQLRLLISAYQKKQNTTIKNFVIFTLEQMATQGLRDHIGGGFFRYTTDPDWQTPHYEKMLYDNANLAMLYFHAADAFNRPDFRSVATETLDFMLRELVSKDGALVSSLSAVDQAGVEGGYYLWEKETLLALLNESEYSVLHLLWNMDVAATADAGYLPRQVITPDEVAKALGLSINEVMGHIGSAYKKLFRVRVKRKIPIDTKQLAAWNGLALSAMVVGSKTKNGLKYKKAAKRIRDYIVRHLSDGKNQLWRATSNSKSIGQAGLEDYAYVVKGITDWAELENSKADFKLAAAWADVAWKKFYSATGWQLSDQSLLPPTLGVAIISDNPMPSASSVLVRTSLRLAKRSNLSNLRKTAERSLTLGEKLMSVQPFYYASQIQAMLQVYK